MGCLDWILSPVKELISGGANPFARDQVLVGVRWGGYAHGEFIGSSSEVNSRIGYELNLFLFIG